jgi:hypothetical protein
VTKKSFLEKKLKGGRPICGRMNDIFGAKPISQLAISSTLKMSNWGTFQVLPSRG